MSSMTDFSKLLNPEQCAAATAGDGPLLVLAAAGTGKTRTLVHRVAYLIERGVEPNRILLLTFTNRAAREMLTRAEQVVGPLAHDIWSGTFHSICARFLRQYGSFLGFKAGFQILDEEDQAKLIGEIIKEQVKDAKDFAKKEVVAKIISEAANESLDVEFVAKRWETKAAGVEPEMIGKIAALYNERKMSLGSMDFDDLLVNGLRLLKENVRIRELLQEHFLYVLVDEYQDTNGLQAEFTDLLAAKHRNILAVGDDFQCIYTWRGAQIENILNFPKRWENCRVIKLEQNYRSVPGVLDVANIVMKDANDQFNKVLRPHRQGMDQKPYLYTVSDDQAQAQEVIKVISQAREMGYRYSDMAVLYRSHFQSIKIQLMLARRGIPHRITSGVGVFEQIHVKDVLAYLRLLMNPQDELSFLRFVSLLPGVGERTAKSYWAKLGGACNVLNANARSALGGMLGKKAQPLWPPLDLCLERAAERLEREEVGALINDFCDAFYADHLRREWEEEDAGERLSDVKELGVQIADAEGGLEGFLSDVALMTNLDARKNEVAREAVTLSTVHQAKGMEWPVVMIPWLAEGMFPSAKAVDEGRTAEERRLFYVAVTRAKDELYMFSPTVRSKPEGGVYPVEMSRFLREIPNDLVTKRSIFSNYPSAPMYPRHSSYEAYRRGAPIYKTTWRH